MANAPLSADELRAIVRGAVRDEFKAIGLRVDDDHADDARDDFRFIRKFRQSFEGVASKVGMALILSIVSGLTYLVWQGFRLVSGK